jgi:hypothetical protein
MDASYPMRDGALAAAFITPLSQPTFSGGLFGSGSSSEATAAASAVPTAASASPGPIASENAANSNNSFLALSARVAAAAPSTISGASGDDRAESAWLNFADQQRDRALTGDTQSDAVDAVPGNAAMQDAGSLQADRLEDGANPATAALLTQATDSCFEKSGWMADGEQLQVATGAHTGDSQAAPALAASVGIVSAWFVRRRRSKAETKVPQVIS